jgi:hypothetical protein
MQIVLKLIRYISKYCKISKQQSAQFLLNVLQENNVFALPENKQKVIFENLICYFDDIIICFDRYGKLENKQNKLISENEILNHIKEKVYNLVHLKSNLLCFH